jgi:hypothetical protein
MLSLYTLHGGRRQGVRRHQDDAAVFVDVHGPGLFLVALSIIGLNLLDAWFTLLFLSYGCRELNPLMQMLIDVGPMTFTIFKTLGIGVCVGFLAITKNFRAARIGIVCVLVGYLLLLVWHLLLLRLLEL